MSVYVMEEYQWSGGVSVLLALTLADIHRKLDEELDDEFFVFSKFGV